MHRRREKFKRDQLFLATALVCNRLDLLLGCFENWLPLGMTHCFDLHVLPLPPP